MRIWWWDENIAPSHLRKGLVNFQPKFMIKKIEN